MDEKQLRIWEELLGARGFGKFKKATVENKGYLRTNYEISEPDGKIRTETWLIDTKGSISPSDIVNYNGFVENSGFDYGVLLTASTLTGSATYVLNESAPLVRVYDNVKFTDLLEQSPEIAKKYGIEIKEVLPKEAKIFLQRLMKCPPGKETWKEYEDLIEEIFTYLFVPPLDKPKSQSRAEDGLEIRDVVFPNRVFEGFWNYVRSEYKGSYIVLEAKNKKESDKNDVLQLGDYLTEKQVGLFSILVSRGISQSAIDQRRKAYSTDPHRMIVLIDEKDTREMIMKKCRRENPEDVLNDRIDLYRLDYRF